jgi:hypothetical protein
MHSDEKRIASTQRWARMTVTTRIFGSHEQQGYELDNEPLPAEWSALSSSRSGQDAWADLAG